MHHKTRLHLIALSSILLLGACSDDDKRKVRDTTAPTLAQVSPVPNGNSTTPSYTFSSDEAGTITYGGDCSSATTAATSGNNTITFNALSVAIHSNCTIKVTDAAANQSATLVVSTFMVGKPINDSGITLCGDYAYGLYSLNHDNTVDCASGASPSATTTSQGTEIGNGADPVPAGQDAVYGRDANPLTNSNTDGHKGFSFTKLKTDGTALVDQTQAWTFDGSGFDNGTEAGGTNWSCVKDNVTGLIWEVKTNKSPEDYRDKDARYTWYNSDSSKNGGNVGFVDAGAGSSCFNTGKCDIQKYVAYVNTQNLCGTNTDWRIPTPEELKTLRKLNTVNPAIDATFIPNTGIDRRYWSASPYANLNTYAWVVNFSDGVVSTDYKGNTYYVRLVRGGQ